MPAGLNKCYHVATGIIDSGIIQKGIYMYCHNCGYAITVDSSFCPGCGTALPNSPKSTQLLGFSDLYQHPEILAAAQNQRKSNFGCALFFILLPLLGFPLAGLLLEDMPLNEAIIIGVGLALLVLIISLVVTAGKTKQMWEGLVVDKRQKRKWRRAVDGSGHRIQEKYMSYTTRIQTDQGKQVQIHEKDSANHMYDYLQLNDRVRFHPAFATYEKYDKSKDSIIYCNVCSMLNPITNERCQRCTNLLFK